MNREHNDDDKLTTERNMVNRYRGTTGLVLDQYFLIT